jgi:inorganic pyrophosphatase
MIIEVLIEASAGSRIKELYDEVSLTPRGRRETLRPYPYAYGFIPGSRGFDGEALDCFVLGREPLYPGKRVRCELLGLLEFFEEGEADHKLLAAPPGCSVTLDEALRDEIETFMLAIFTAYPEVEVSVGRLLMEVETRQLLGSRLSFGDKEQ